MGKFQNVIDTLLRVLAQFGALIAALLTALEVWLRDELRSFGVPHSVQTVILLAVAALLVVGSLRLFGGLIRVAVVLILLLIAIHIVIPAIQS